MIRSKIPVMLALVTLLLSGPAVALELPVEAPPLPSAPPADVDGTVAEAAASAEKVSDTAGSAVTALVEDLSACRDAARIEVSRGWYGTVTDERDVEAELLASVRAQVLALVAAAPLDVTGLLSHVPAEATETARVVQEMRLPADVHVAWREEFVQWQHVVDTYFVVLPVGVLAADVGGVLVSVCDDTVPLLHEVPGDRPPTSKYHALLEPEDGWVVDAWSVDVAPVLSPAAPASELPFDKGWAIAPQPAMREAARLLEETLVTLYAVIEEPPTEEADGEEADAAQSAPDVEWEPADRDGTQWEAETQSQAQAIHVAGLQAQFGALLALFALVLGLMMLKRR